ncbi:lysophospholipid acyltransferase family protein [Syntrophus gentianae]|nr:lysophospholipid acyltransferase family protein [Syntrophus gentianae]
MLKKIGKFLADLFVTLLLWIYYIPGFLLFFSPFYLFVLIFSRNREAAFQRLNSLFYRSFFGLVRLILPHVRFEISPDVSAIRSSVILCNHLSYLDPILLISLFPAQKTIVKSDIFHIPIFGGLLRQSGYLPSLTEESNIAQVTQQVQGMKEYLAAGGNLFVFPEGTRSRDGRIGPFNKGAFRIARICQAPVCVLSIRNTHRLFPPGRFLFNTTESFTIFVKQAGRLEPDYENPSFSLTALMEKVRTLMENVNGEV